MDPTEIRPRKIELAFHAAEKIAELHTQRRLAVLAVALAIAGSAAIAGAAGQIPPSAAIGASIVVVSLATDQTA